MAKEVELKKIELRVSANCCEGCKRKVKKALRSVEGVLKTEIDPFRPKMTVLGNVNPQIIIKKLLKVGKHAELSRYEELKAEKKETTEKKEAETVAVTTEKEKQNNGWKQEKQSDTIENKTEKSKDIIGSGDGGKNKDSKKDNKEKNIAANASSNPQDMKRENPPMPPHPEVGFKVTNMTANASSNPQDMKKENSPLSPHPEVDFTNHPDMDCRVHPYSNVKTSPQYCYFAQPQPCAVAAPCYVMPSYPASPLPPTRVEEYYHFDKPSYHYQSPFWRPTERVGDYFSDENTVGCHVM